MNIACIICSDLFSPASSIYITTCGHLFHYHCVTQWLERAKTCPQCRSKVTDKTINRVFFNITSAEGIIEDAVTLQAKIDNLQFDVKLKEKSLKTQEEKYKTIKTHNIALREELKESENKVRVCESAMSAMKEQIVYFKSKAKESDKIRDEVVRLKGKLQEVEDVQLVIDGSKDQVNDMLRVNQDTQSLALLVTTLKKALVESDRRKRDLENSVKQSQNDAHKFRNENIDLKQKVSKLTSELECHKNCECERQYLKRKIVSLQTKSTESPDTSTKRIIAESPAPFLNEPTLDSSSRSIILVADSPPTQTERVHVIKDTPSPYLSLKSSSTGLNYINLMNKKLPAGANKNKFSAFKHALLESDNKILQSDYSYDGLGGHSKDDMFPEGRRHQIGIKRHKVVPSSSSAKHRKLSFPTKKIDSFLNKNES